jgi:hypothetical protein
MHTLQTVSRAVLDAHKAGVPYEEDLSWLSRINGKTSIVDLACKHPTPDIISGSGVFALDGAQLGMEAIFTAPPVPGQEIVDPDMMEYMNGVGLMGPLDDVGT